MERWRKEEWREDTYFCLNIPINITSTKVMNEAFNTRNKNVQYNLHKQKRLKEKGKKEFLVTFHIYESLKRLKKM